MTELSRIRGVECNGRQTGGTRDGELGVPAAQELERQADKRNKKKHGNHPSFRKSRRQRPIFRLIYAHNTRIDLPFHPHESSPYFTDSTLVRPTLDKSTDSDTESETDPNHPRFRKSRRQRPIFRLICTHNTRINLSSHPYESCLYFTDSTLVRPTLALPLARGLFVRTKEAMPSLHMQKMAIAGRLQLDRAG